MYKVENATHQLNATVEIVQLVHWNKTKIDCFDINLTGKSCIIGKIIAASNRIELVK